MEGLKGRRNFGLLKRDAYGKKSFTVLTGEYCAMASRSARNVISAMATINLLVGLLCPMSAQVPQCPVLIEIEVLSWTRLSWRKSSGNAAPESNWAWCIKSDKGSDDAPPLYI